MEFIKQQIDKGNLQLAKFDSQNKPVPMQLSELEQKRDVHNKRTLILQKLKTLSEDQKEQWVHLKKLHANELYKAQKWDQASDTYLQAMLGLDTNGKSGQNIIRINREVKYPILLNIATCMFKKRQFKAAVQICNKVLQQNDGKNFVKAYYKKAFILKEDGRLSESKQVAIAGIKILLNNSGYKPTGGKQIKNQDFIKLLDEISAKTDNDKSFYKKIFIKEEDSDFEQDEKQGLIKKQNQELLIYNESMWYKMLDCCRNTMLWFDLRSQNRTQTKNI